MTYPTASQLAPYVVALLTVLVLVLSFRLGGYLPYHGSGKKASVRFTRLPLAVALTTILPLMAVITVTGLPARLAAGTALGLGVVLLAANFLLRRQSPGIALPWFKQSLTVVALLLAILPAILVWYGNALRSTAIHEGERTLYAAEQAIHQRLDAFAEGVSNQPATLTPQELGENLASLSVKPSFVVIGIDGTIAFSSTPSHLGEDQYVRYPWLQNLKSAEGNTLRGITTLANGTPATVIAMQRPGADGKEQAVVVGHYLTQDSLAGAANADNLALISKYATVWSSAENADQKTILSSVDLKRQVAGKAADNSHLFSFQAKDRHYALVSRALPSLDVDNYYHLSTLVPTDFSLTRSHGQND